MNDERTKQLHSLTIERTEDPQGTGGPGWAALLIAIVLAGGGGAGAVWLFSPKAEPAPITVAETSRTSSETVETAPAVAPATSTRPAPSSGLVASGYVVARRQATVSAEITGRIRDVLIEEGAVVEAGEVLAYLDDDRAQIDLDLYEAQQAAAAERAQSFAAQVTEARTQLTRTEQLISSGYATDSRRTAEQAQVDSLQAQLSAARADLAAARVRVRSQRDYVDRHVVRAPFGGVVIAKNAQVGEILSPVSAGGGFTRTGIATLVDMDSLELEVDVNEGQIQRVRAGQRVEAILDAYPDWRIPARVEAIIPTADRARATIRVRVALGERDDRVLPDMAARVTFLEQD